MPTEGWRRVASSGDCRSWLVQVREVRKAVVSLGRVQQEGMGLRQLQPLPLSSTLWQPGSRTYASLAKGGCDNCRKQIINIKRRKAKTEKTDCCWRLSCREQRVSQPGNGHLWFLSPVCTREWRARCPLVVKARSHI